MPEQIRDGIIQSGEKQQNDEEKGDFDYRTGKLVWQLKYNKWGMPEDPPGAVIINQVHLTHGQEGFYKTALVPEGTQWGEEKTFDWVKKEELWGSTGNYVGKFSGADQNPAYLEWEKDLNYWRDTYFNEEEDKKIRLDLSRHHGGGGDYYFVDADFKFIQPENKKDLMEYIKTNPGIEFVPPEQWSKYSILKTADGPNNYVLEGSDDVDLTKGDEVVSVADYIKEIEERREERREKREDA